MMSLRKGMTMQDVPNKRHAPKMVRIGLLFLCLAYAHTAMAAVAHQRHSSPSKKTTIMTCAPPKHSCTCPNGFPGQATCCSDASQCRCTDTLPPTPYCG
jgi:hypothetical protein